MSIINQMLKDLDDRRGPAFGTQLAALQGLGLVNTNRILWQNGLALAGRGLVAVIVIIIGYQSAVWWLHNERNTSPSEHTLHTLQTGTPEIPVREVAPEVETETGLQRLAVSGADPQPPAALPETEERQIPQTSPVQKVVPVKVLTPEQKADRLFASAQLALADNRQTRGEQLLLEALETFPLHSDARTQLAALLIDWQRSGDAEQLLAEGLAGNPRNLDLAMPYAQLLAARNAPDPALEILDQAIGQNRASAEALALRAALLYRLDRHSESMTAYRSALQIQPQRALWWTGLAVALEHDLQPGEALHAYRRAATLPLEQAVAEYVQQRIRLLSRGPTQD